MLTNFKEKPLKGIVQREITGVENVISQKKFLSHWSADILFWNLKGTCSLNWKKTYSAVWAKISGFFVSIGCLPQRANSGKPIHIHGW